LNADGANDVRQTEIVFAAVNTSDRAFEVDVAAEKLQRYIHRALKILSGIDRSRN
jgi:hypothetical protein